MGTCCTPTYANLYLGGWEHDLFADERDPNLLSNIQSWWRYIDNVFMLWAGSTQSLHRFMSMLSENQYNLRFMMEYSESSIAFLDVTISLHSDGSISTSLYRKLTAGNTILHAASAHPHSLVQSIPFSQYLHLRRNCSSEESRVKLISSITDLRIEAIVKPALKRL